MTKFLPVLVLFFLVQSAWGQTIAPNWAPRSSTLEEGLLRGSGAYWGDRGRYLESLGRYENLHADAIAKSAESWATAVRIRHDVRDEWKSQHHTDYVAKENVRLDNVIRLHQLKEREAELIKAGVLSPKPASHFVWHNQSFVNYAEFKSSPAYNQFIAERDEKFRLEKEAELVKKQKYNEAIYRLRYQGKLTPEERTEMLREPTMREIMGEKLWQDWQKYHPYSTEN